MAFGLAVALAGSAEFALRAAGFEPSVEPEGTAWMVARAAVDRTSVVFAGTSRLQTDVDPIEWRDEVGGPAPIQLSMVGTSPLPIAEAVASDIDFEGTLVLEVMPRFFWNTSPTAEQAAEAMVRRYRASEVSPSARIERWIWARTAGRLVVQNPELRLPRLLEALWARRPVQPVRWRSRTDRFTPMDRALVTGAPGDEEAFYQAVATPTPSDVTEVIERVLRLASLLESRGGELVLVGLPACGASRELEERYYPRSEYWDRLVDGSGVRAILAYDHAELTEFSCADGSHLDYRDVPAFTRALARRVSPRDTVASARTGGAGRESGV
jgi:hypothetical protein